MQVPYLSLQKITAMHAEEIQCAIADVVNGGWYLQGENIKAFEYEYAEYVGAEHCITCANGLDALTLTLRAYKELGIMHDGDEIIVPANTYIATILAISENNLKPVLVEPRIDTLQIDDTLIERAITPKTKAIMLVNLYGINAFTDKIGNICTKNGLKLIIDNAQGHGLTLPKKADAVCHSFYPGKNLGALGDAGCMTTDDVTLANALRSIANYGSSRKYVFDFKGRNSRMDEIHAAALRVKLRYLDEDNNRRIEIARMYNENIENGVCVPKDKENVVHIYPIMVKDRDLLQRYLSEHGIGTMIHYPIPPHKQKAYKEWNTLSLPITEQIHRQELSLPCNPAMTDKEVDYIISTVNSFPN